MRLLLLLLASACALALLAAPASATTNATSDGATVTVTAAPGVANDVTVEPGDAAGTVRITDGGDDVAPSPGCDAVTAATVQCMVSGTVEVDLGDRDDHLSAAAAAPVAVEADGGEGDDTFAVGNGIADTLHCGPGRDDASDADAQDAADADCEETLETAGPPDTSIADAPATLTREDAATFAFGATEPATFECSLDGADFAGCDSTPTFGDLADGDHELRVRAVDLVGKTDAAPAAYAFTVDTTAPAVSFSSTPGATTNRTTAGFAFAAADPAATVECRLDAAAWAPCASPTAMQYAGLADGAHTVTVRATDLAGNAGEVAWTWTQDTVRPQTVLTGGPASSIPVTTDRATLTFAAQGGDHFECSLDGGGWQACASPVTYTGLASGTHTFGVRAVDAAGNVDGTPSTRTWTVRIDGAPTALVSVRRDGDGFVLDAGRSSDPDGGALTYRWTRNGAAAGTGATVRYAAPGEVTRDVFTVTAGDAGGLRGVASVALRTRATTETAPQDALEVIRFSGRTRLAPGAARAHRGAPHRDPRRRGRGARARRGLRPARRRRDRRRRRAGPRRPRPARQGRRQDAVHRGRPWQRGRRREQRDGRRPRAQRPRRRDRRLPRRRRAARHRGRGRSRDQLEQRAAARRRGDRRGAEAVRLLLRTCPAAFAGSRRSAAASTCSRRTGTRSARPTRPSAAAVRTLASWRCRGAWASPCGRSSTRRCAARRSSTRRPAGRRSWRGSRRSPRATASTA